MEQGTIRTSDAEKAKKLAAQGANVELVNDLEEKKSKRRPDYADVDGDGDKTEPMAKAFKDKKEQEIEEGKAGKVAAGIAIVAALLGINKAASEKIYDSSPKVKAAVEKYEKAKKEGNKEDMAKYKEEIKKEKIKIDKGLDEAKKIELPADTTFTLDLKHLIKKHLDEGKSQEDVVKLTKALMKKLHDKGEVKVNGTKVIFKEMRRPPGGPTTNKEKLASLSPEEREKYQKDLGDFSDFEDLDLGDMNEQDTPLALPKPAPNFLGDDNMDYEGGMAKSQLLKMKKYAMALCDMIEDESQLEAWVQAKLTKASDYISSVYHYLEYENQSNETPDQGIY